MKFFKGRAYPEVISGFTEGGAMMCIIGQVSELVKMDLIYNDNTEGNMDKWLLLDKQGNCFEFDSKKEAKEAARQKFDSSTH